MQLDFDFEKMKQLLTSFYKISGVRYSLLDMSGNVLCCSSDFSPFCSRMNADEEGHDRCRKCDAHAVAYSAHMTAPYYTYRCHAGLLETIIPVRQLGDTIACIIFGQFVDDGDMESQWLDTQKRIRFLPHPESLRDPFLALQQIGPETIQGCADILNACSSYICMEGVIRRSSMSDEQLLDGYIAAHYTEKLTLDGMARALSMSKTRLCSIAAGRGTTVMTMVNQKRMEEAKRLLRHVNDRVSEVAHQVGIHDYSYFTKLFTRYVGETPSAYQKRRGMQR